MKALIVTNGGIGDQIQYSSLIKAIKKKYPDSEITVFCHEQLVPFYKMNKLVDNAISSISSDMKFDLGYNFAIRKDLCVIFTETPIEKRYGYIYDSNRLLPTNKEAEKLMISALDHKRNSVFTLNEWFCKIAELDVEPTEVYFEKVPKDVDIVIQYKTSKEFKNWPLDYLKQLIEKFQDKKVWITTSTKNLDDLKELNVNILAGEIEDLDKTANMISNAKLLITPDTVTMHMGIALKIKTLVLTTDYDRGFSIPENNENVIVIREKLMNDILPETVISKVNQLI